MPPLTRIIPAHAGSTQMWSMALTAVAGHPRSRGVNGDDDVRRREEAGSSPLTRGQPTVSRGATLALRVIPAHAGSTRGWRLRR